MLKKIDFIKKIINFLEWFVIKIKSNHKMICFLRKIHIPINEPLSNFKSIYAFSLADISEGNPSEIVEFLEKESIRKRIEHAINQVSIDDIEEEVLSSLDENVELNHLDVDVKIILNRFINFFKINLEKSQNINDIVLTNQVKKIKESIINFNETKVASHSFHYSKQFIEINPLIIPQLPDYYISRNVYEEQIICGILPTSDAKTFSKSTIAIIGSYGVGKSTLILSVCRNQEVKSYFQKIIVLTFSEIEDLSIENVLQVFFNALGGKAEKELSKMEYISNIRLLLENQKTLLILDDVDNSEEINDIFSCKTDTCTIVLTTRNRDLSFRLETTNIIEIKGFSKQEYISFVKTYLQEKISNEKISNEILHVGKIIDFNPLASKLICADIRLGNYSWKEILEDLSNNFNNILEFPNPKNKSQSIEKSIDFSLKHLSPKERELFALLSVFPRGIPFFEEDAAMIFNAFEHGKISEKKSQDIVRKDTRSLLQKYYSKGIIERDDSSGIPRYFLHSLLLENGIRYLTDMKLLDKAIIIHLYIYLNLFLTDLIDYKEFSNTPFFFPQIELILSRAIRGIHRQKGLVISEELAEHVILLIIDRLGTYLINTGQLSRAEYWYLQVINLPKKDEFLKIRKRAFEELSLIYITNGDLASANQKYYDYVNNDFPGKKESEVIDGIQFKTNILIAEEKYSEALELINTIDITIIDDDETLGLYYSRKNKIFIGLRMWKDAFLSINRSIACAEKTNNIHALAKRLGDLSAYYLLNDNPNVFLSIDKAIESIRLSNICGDLSTALNRYLTLTKIYIALEKTFLASYCLSCCYKIVNIIHDKQKQQIIQELRKKTHAFEKKKTNALIPEIFELTFNHFTKGKAFDTQILFSMLKKLPKDSAESLVIEIVCQLYTTKYDPFTLIERLPSPQNYNLAILILSIENPEFSYYIYLILHQYGFLIAQRKNPNFANISSEIKTIEGKTFEKDNIKHDLIFLCQAKLTPGTMNIEYLKSQLRNKLIIKFFEDVIENKQIGKGIKKHKKKQ